MRKSGIIAFLLLTVITLMTTLSCNKVPGLVHQSVTGELADSVIQTAYKNRDYKTMLLMADSFETAGGLSEVKANYWRGYACSRMRQMRRAELYWKAAIEGDITADDNMRYYLKSANRLSSMLLLKRDYDGSMKVAMAAMEKMEAVGGDTISDFANLLTSIASCQLKLGMMSEAYENYSRAYKNYQAILENNPVDANYKAAATCIITTTSTYLSEEKYEDALQWTDKFAELLANYETRSSYDSIFLDKAKARQYFYQATALQGMNRTKDAAKAYSQGLNTNYAKTGDGLIEACEYLMAARRWKEAVVNFRILDKQASLYDLTTSFDNIQLYYLPKFEANVMAGNRDSAISVAGKVFGFMDSAITEQKKSGAAELATIYDTQQKEAQIAQQEAEMSNQRLIGTGVALVLVMAFFITYTLLKRRSAHRLAVAHGKLEEAHAKLQTAYGQLEETTKAKERIESELRIASDIQQSMLPSVFPNLKGLDLYGSMTPAKEVGGDLYDFLLTDKYLYFCLGDVSGKGVPASLFMAQAIRMFRALAKQGVMPADIANRLNDELAAGNENGMFVTMFMGLIDLQTGHMDYCNAGHNPPVLDGKFMEMESNAPIGLWEDLEYVGEEYDNVKGKTIFVYSDGLNEAENRQQEHFGDDHLLTFLTQGHFKTARQVIDAFNAEVEKHRDGADPNDDLTMLCLRVS